MDNSNNIKDCILITHQFIKPKDQEWKFTPFYFCISYYRKYNPNSYLILTGHGIKPPDKILNMVDWYYWSETIIDGEIDKGHPYLCSVGIQHAIEKRI